MNDPAVSPRPGDPYKIVGPTPVDSAGPAQKSVGGTDPAARAEPRRAVAVTYDRTTPMPPSLQPSGKARLQRRSSAGPQGRRARHRRSPGWRRSLSQIDVGQMIPPELYAVVAEVLVYVYHLEERVANRRG